MFFVTSLIQLGNDVSFNTITQIRKRCFFFYTITQIRKRCFFFTLLLKLENDVFLTCMARARKRCFCFFFACLSRARERGVFQSAFLKLENNGLCHISTRHIKTCDSNSTFEVRGPCSYERSKDPLRSVACWHARALGCSPLAQQPGMREL